MKTLQETVTGRVHDHQVKAFLGENTDTYFRCPADPLNASPDNYKDTEKSPLTIAYPAYINMTDIDHLYIGRAYQVAMTGLMPARLLHNAAWGDYTVCAKAAQFIVFEALKPQFIGHFSENEFFRAYRIYVVENTLDMMQQCSTWATTFMDVLKTLSCHDEVLEELQSKGLYRITPLKTKYRHTHTLQRDFTKLGNVLYPDATKVILHQNTHKSKDLEGPLTHEAYMNALSEYDAAAYAQYYR